MQRYSFLLAFLTGCNLLSFIDKPSSSAQNLEAARTSFDQGKLEDAINYYNQINDPSYANIVLFEEILAEIDKIGIDISFLIDVLKKVTNLGDLINPLANKLKNQASESLRLEIYNIFLKSKKLQNSSEKRFLKFLLTFLLSSELFSEIIQNNTLRQTDIADDPTNCKNFTTTLINTDSICNSSNPKLSVGNSIILLNDSTIHSFKGSVTLFMIQAAFINFLNTSNDVNLNQNTRFHFQNTLNNLPNQDLTQSINEKLFRATLLNAGIGSTQ